MIYSMEELGENSRDLIGGKAHQLAWLHQNGLNVPDFSVLSTELFEKILNGLIERDSWAKLITCLKNGEVTTSEYSSYLTEKLDRKLQDVDAIKSLKYFLKSLPVEKSFAVRSSMVGEDGVKESFAGQLETYLNIRGEIDLKSAVLNCVKSLFSERVTSYLLRNDLDLMGLKIAVIIQEMIPAEKSGVLFSMNPSNRRVEEILISAGYGLGEGVVSGEIDCDEYTYHVSSEKIEKRIAEKNEVLNINADYSGTSLNELSKEHRLASVLSDEEIKELVGAGLKISKFKGAPQDIEWCYFDNKLFFLQTRPITSSSQFDGAEKIVFDNSNIQESFNGLTKPLTFTFANEAYRRVYNSLLEVMGFSRRKIEEEDQRHQNMLAIVKGRVFYNIRSWYDGLLLTPSFGRNKKDMEMMMGVEEPVEFVENHSLSSIEKLKRLPSVVNLIVRMSFQFARLSTSVRKFRSQFNSDLEKISDRDFYGLSGEEIHRKIDLAQRLFLKNWQVPVINDFFVMMYTGKVRRQLEKVGIEALLPDLMAGEDVESTKPTKEILKIAEYIKSNPNLKDEVLKNRHNLSLDKIADLDREPYDRVEKYIASYGDRVIGELKLESKSLREDPSFLFKTLISYIENENISIESFESREDRRKNEVESKIKVHFNIFSRIFLDANLKKMRNGIKNREAMRLDRTRSFGFFRKSYRAIGYSLVARKCLKEVDDIFYLTMGEIKDFLSGKALFDDPRALVELRKKQYMDWSREDVPNHFASSMPITSEALENRFRRDKDKDETSRQGVALKGLGCYPGIVESEVVVARSPNEAIDLEGKILVAERTDPGWTPLFLQIKGLIVEKGSLLSHSAIVAREMGVPTVVGIKDATQVFETGQRLRLDGEAGEVQVCTELQEFKAVRNTHDQKEVVESAQL